MKNKFMLTLLTIFLSHTSVASQAVNPNTFLTIFYPDQYSSNRCDAKAFDDRVKSLAMTSTPLTNAISEMTTNSKTHRTTLTVSLSQANITNEVINIEGDKSILQDIANDFTHGKPINLTEFKRCATHNPNLRFVKLATTTALAKYFPINLQAKMEYIQPAENTVCAPVFIQSLGQTISAYNYGIDLGNIGTKITVHAKSFKSDGTMAVKELLLSFYELNNPTQILKAPVFVLNVSADLIYAAINKFTSPIGEFHFTNNAACKGKHADDPFWVYK